MRLHAEMRTKETILGMLRNIRYSCAKAATDQQILDVKRLYKRLFGERLPISAAKSLRWRASIPLGRVIHYMESLQPRRKK